MYSILIKRLLDIILSFIAIIVLMPAYLIVLILVRIEMGSPILFSQKRIGRNGEPFKLYKFRSMTNARDEKGNLLDESKRLTKFGTFLRSTSLDELPELFMILLGKMSIIGPRPLPTFYDPYFHENERIRHKVSGGLIPPDSLSKKAFTTWEEQFEYETYYAQHVSFILDLKVLFAAFAILIKRFASHYGSEFRPHLNIYRSNEHKQDVVSASK